jgi:hypothetical protein
MLKLKSTKAEKAKRTRRINKAKKKAGTFITDAKGALGNTIGWLKDNPSEAILLVLTVALVDIDGDIEEIADSLN